MRRRLIAGAAALVLAYPVAGVIGGVLPANPGWRPPADGVTLWVETNGVHTGIIMPKVAAGVDWRVVFPARDLVDPRFAGHDHVAVGWGERDFYLGTPTWADVRPATVAAAAVGSAQTLLHVDHLPRPIESASVRRLVVRPAEYRRLAGYIMATLVAGGTRHHGYFGNDAFYQARGRYSAIRTCNAWTGDALRFAGIRVGRWTPFPETVLWWFPAAQPSG